MAPTTLRSKDNHISFWKGSCQQGYPLRMSELLATIEAYYIARFSLHNAANILRAKKGIKQLSLIR